MILIRQAIIFLDLIMTIPWKTLISPTPLCILRYPNISSKIHLHFCDGSPKLSLTFFNVSFHEQQLVVIHSFISVVHKMFFK